MSDHIFVRDEAVRHVRYSDRRAKTFAAAGSSFTACDFTNVRWTDCGWGAGRTPALYSDCNFDGAHLQARVPGIARFERCTFRNVRLRNWHCDAVEFVDCVFTGTLTAMVFHGSLEDPYTAFLSRTRNEFHGNDFSGARLEDVGFRGGIDLTRQILPEQDNLLLVLDALAAVARVEGLINVWDDMDNRARAQGLIRFLRRLTDSGQLQLLLEADDLRKVFGPVVWARVQPALASERA